MQRNSSHTAIRRGSTPKRIVFIVGPTACGKTEIAVDLAKKIDGEIISCDSMQVYNGMKILTQAPSRQHLREVKHYLVSEVSPEKEFSAALFSRKTSLYIKKILKKGKTPIIAGGTGLYVKAFVDGLFPSPKKDIYLRERLAKRETRALYEKLKKIDRVSATKIHPNDKRRIVRALEVYYLTGIPISRQMKKTKGMASRYNIKMIGIWLPRDILYRRIERRVDGMFEKGLVNEVKRLAGQNLSKTARAAMGIEEVLGYIKGLYSLEEARHLLKKNTRHLAKKQLMWFKADKRIEWVDANRPEEEVVSDIIDLVGHL